MLINSTKLLIDIMWAYFEVRTDTVYNIQNFAGNDRVKVLDPLMYNERVICLGLNKLHIFDRWDMK